MDGAFFENTGDQNHGSSGEARNSAPGSLRSSRLKRINDRPPTFLVRARAVDLTTAFYLRPGETPKSHTRPSARNFAVTVPPGAFYFAFLAKDRVAFTAPGARMKTKKGIADAAARGHRDSHDFTPGDECRSRSSQEPSSTNKASFPTDMGSADRERGRERAPDPEMAISNALTST